MRFVAASLVALALIVGLWHLTGAPSVQAQPQVTEMVPQDGDRLSQPPPVIHLCFDRPVDISSADSERGFQFRFLTPEGRPLGLRIVFQRDGYGVNIYPGLPEEPPEGEWTFEWRVTDAQTGEAASGVARFTIGPGGRMPPEEPPGLCGPGGTFQITPGPTTTPVPGPVSPVSGSQENGGGPDVFRLAWITAASVVGAGLVGLFLYLVRLRIGFWLHRPPPRDGGQGGEHH